ncbi:LuxR C-terminal-related transcriptional regulator [Streptomyces sp. CB03238]|uniref:helix-turn-helix transcriptional regulator n=1 Tax=Streptomyces sp. CB03238 TaxID=1907777 RepID=UPI001F4DD220|nr:LuxR C-terminal-related transcriptional regulator [Streptomyces sp. CB03238]
MPYLGKADYERMLDLAVALLESHQPDTLRQLIAQELLRALDGTVLITKDEEWTPSSGAVAAWHRDAPAPTELDDRTSQYVRAGYPFASHYAIRPNRGPRTAAQLAGDRVWPHSETASAMRRSFGTRHMLGLPLPDPHGSVRGFVVHRAGTDFDTQDLLYATRVQPLLSAAVAQYRLLTRWRQGGVPGTPTTPCGLTPRETAVLLTLAEGLPATAIARRLGVSVRTVHKHLQNLYRKLDTVDRLGAVLRAQELGLLTAPAPARSGGRGRARGMARGMVSPADSGC